MREQRALSVDLSTGYYRVERIRDPEIIGPVDYGLRRWADSRALCLGGGPFMGSVLPGSNRLIVTGHSPCWDGFYVSTMGGAAAIFDNLGLDFVALEGRCPAPSALVLRRERQELVHVERVPVDPEAVWRGVRGEGAAGQDEGEGEEEVGFHALQRHLWDRFAGSFSTSPRILAVGPAALATDFGAIGSSSVSKGALTAVECWAGRGGLGSRMARHHNLFGVVYGGSYLDVDLDDHKLANSYFTRRYDLRMSLKDKQATEKYRYDPALKTGGTFGVNYTKLKDRLFFFNYRSVSWPLEARLQLHKDLIVEHYLRQFNEETIANKRFAHCGETCLAVCKKMWGRFKKDYEPYQTMGPLSGIFDQRSAERLVGLCDAMGFDAIQLGGVLSWLLELWAEGLLDPAGLGLEGAPVFEPAGFSAAQDSETNARLAAGLVRAIIARRGELDLSRGAREAARRIGARTGATRQVVDRLVVNCAGERGWMVPNQYWVPGMFSPMPIMGKYFQHYGDDFVPPRVLGRVSAQRMAMELFLDNMGFCRFHRDWAEELLPEIYREFWQDETDLQAHHLALARRINAMNASVFWESRRIVELLHGYLRRKAAEGTPRQELTDWLARFAQDPVEAARDYWYEIRKGVDEALAAPLDG